MIVKNIVEAGTDQSYMTAATDARHKQTEWYVFAGFNLIKVTNKDVYSLII